MGHRGSISYAINQLLVIIIFILLYLFQLAEGFVRIVDQRPSGIVAPRQGVAPSQRGAAFEIPHQEAAISQPSVTAQLHGIDSLQGLMALQEVSVPATFRRQKAAKRGFRLLDALGG